MPEIEEDFLIHQGRNIKLARQFKGVKNEDLAKMLNISTATLSRLENQQKVDEDMLKNIALALDVQLNSLKTFSLDKEFSTLNNVVFNDAVSVTDGGDNVGVKEEHNTVPIDIFNRMLEEAEEKGRLQERVTWLEKMNAQLAAK